MHMKGNIAEAADGEEPRGRDGGTHHVEGAAQREGGTHYTLPISVWWDIENTHKPVRVDGESLWKNIEKGIRTVLPHAYIRSFTATGNLARLVPQPLQESLERQGVVLVEVDDMTSNASDIVLSRQILNYLEDCPRPHAVLILSGDHGFQVTIQNCSRQGILTLVAFNMKSASDKLYDYADVVWDWRELVYGRRPFTSGNMHGIHTELWVGELLKGLDVLEFNQVPPVKEYIKDFMRNVNFEGHDFRMLVSYAKRNGHIRAVSVSKGGARFYLPYGKKLWVSINIRCDYEDKMLLKDQNNVLCFQHIIKEASCRYDAAMKLGYQFPNMLLGNFYRIFYNLIKVERKMDLPTSWADPSF